VSKTTDDGETATERRSGASAATAKIPDEAILADLTRIARETADCLSEREYAARGEYGVTTVRRRFGSWNAAKRRAGLPTRQPERIDDADLLDDVRRVAREVEGSLAERDYADRGAYGVTTLRRRFGSWNAAKRQAGVETAGTERSTEAIADDVARVAADLDGTYVTPDAYAEYGRYPLSSLPTDAAFWDDLRSRVGLAITPLYHKVARDTDG
jgi:hypothetical protein